MGVVLFGASGAYYTDSLEETLNISESFGVNVTVNTGMTETLSIQDSFEAFVPEMMEKPLFFLRFGGESFIPMSSFQIQMTVLWAGIEGGSAGSIFYGPKVSTYKCAASVVVPGFKYYDEISADPNSFRIYMGYLHRGSVVIQLKCMADVITSTFNTEEMVDDLNINVSGQRKQGNAVKTLTILNPQQRNAEDGKFTFKYARTNPFIRPGDILQTETEIFQVDRVTHAVSSNSMSMSISGA